MTGMPTLTDAYDCIHEHSSTSDIIYGSLATWPFFPSSRDPELAEFFTTNGEPCPIDNWGDVPPLTSRQQAPSRRLVATQSRPRPITEAEFMPFSIPLPWDVIMNRLFAYTPDNNWVIPCNPKRAKTRRRQCANIQKLQGSLQRVRRSHAAIHGTIHHDTDSRHQRGTSAMHLRDRVHAARVHSKRSAVPLPTHRSMGYPPHTPRVPPIRQNSTKGYSKPSSSRSPPRRAPATRKRRSIHRVLDRPGSRLDSPDDVTHSSCPVQTCAISKGAAGTQHGPSTAGQTRCATPPRLRRQGTRMPMAPRRHGAVGMMGRWPRDRKQ